MQEPAVSVDEKLAFRTGKGPTINAEDPPAPRASTPQAAPALARKAAPAALTHEQKFQQEKELKGLMSMAEEGLNSRFSDMYKAFQYIDLDRSGGRVTVRGRKAQVALAVAKLDELLEGNGEKEVRVSQRQVPLRQVLVPAILSFVAQSGLSLKLRIKLESETLLQFQISKPNNTLQV